MKWRHSSAHGSGSGVGGHGVENIAHDCMGAWHAQTGKIGKYDKQASNLGKIKWQKAKTSG